MNVTASSSPRTGLADAGGVSLLLEALDSLAVGSNEATLSFDFRDDMGLLGEQ